MVKSIQQIVATFVHKLKRDRQYNGQKKNDRKTMI